MSKEELIKENDYLECICEKMCDLFIPSNEKESFKLCLYSNSYNVILQYLNNLELKLFEKEGLIKLDEFVEQGDGLYHYE